MESSELLTILEQIERDKGIKKEVLIEAVESAVASAARKLWTVDKEEDVRVELDPISGKLKAFAGEEEIRNSEFGRIAAQTAKQVVIQKIREAEKDVVFTEYSARIGEIISGSVYRIDRGNIVIDLGKTEAYVPRKEQSSKEEFRQGDRIRAYVLDVRRENRGPQIVLSRAHPNFVKRLFELEVPEIFEGIVEIKSISRDVSERTKISVFSKDDKVDSVGACVGMRGSRVKNIVSELQGEKIDIVRYSEDIKEYIQAALSPAEISQIQLNFDDKKANIIVADDQLSLAIGKHGQNVRLASQLVGWELDLFTSDQWQELEEEENAEEQVESEEETEEFVEEISLENLTGVGAKMIEKLEEAGFDDIEKIANADLIVLAEVKGLSEPKAEKMIAEAKELLEDSEIEEVEEEAEEEAEEEVEEETEEVEEEEEEATEDEPEASAEEESEDKKE